MEVRNSDDNTSLEQRNNRRREKSCWGVTPGDSNGARNPSLGTNEIQSATNLNRSVRDFAYSDRGSYEKRYQGRSHRVCNYERQVDSRGCDPSVGTSSSNITVPRKNLPRMWDYSGRCERRWNQRKWDYECKVDNIVNDPYVDRYSANEALPTTNSCQLWDYDKRYQQRWNERVWNNNDPYFDRYSANEALPTTNSCQLWDYDKRYQQRWNERVWNNNDPYFDRYSANEALPTTNSCQLWDYDKRYQQRWNERVWNNKCEVLPVNKSLGMWDHNVRYERKRNQRTRDNESRVDNRGSISSLHRSSSNGILPMTNPPEPTDQETRCDRRKKQRMCDFERKVEDSSNVPSVVISAVDSILSETNPSVNASVKTCTNSEPIITQPVEVEDNLMGGAPISSGVGEAPSLSEVLKDESGVMVKENAISQLGDSSEEAHLIVPRRKKLIILDVNGLLADFVQFFPKGYKPHIIIGGKAVYKRPFCEDFLQFCFEHFEVGVWSSRARKNVNLVINFLMGDLKHKLLFCWDKSHCTKTGFKTVEERSKPLVLKELRKIWEKLDPNLPYEKGEFNKSNTVLLDDSPYKALRNPPNTSIFPRSFCYTDLNDTSLGPGGDLRVYLEGLAMAENIQEYIKKNPFGQSPITRLNPSWGYYRQILHSTRYVPYFKKKRKDGTAQKSK